VIHKWATKSAPGQGRSLTKKSQFCTLIPPPILELKIGEVHRIPRKYVGYLTSIVTLNLNYLKSGNSKKQNFPQDHAKEMIFVGKTGLGGISKPNSIPLLRSWELNRTLYIGNDALTVFSGSIEGVYFCEFSLLIYLSAKSPIFAVKSLLPTHFLSLTCDILLLYNK